MLVDIFFSSAADLGRDIGGDLNDGFTVDCTGGDFRVFCRKEFGLKRGGDFMISDGLLKF